LTSRRLTFVAGTYRKDYAWYWNETGLDISEEYMDIEGMYRSEYECSRIMHLPAFLYGLYVTDAHIYQAYRKESYQVRKGFMTIKTQQHETHKKR